KRGFLGGGAGAGSLCGMRVWPHGPDDEGASTGGGASYWPRRLGPAGGGGAMKQRSTGSGTPLAARKETSASPTPSSVMAVWASNFLFGRKVSAAVFTAFLSRGVDARTSSVHPLRVG